MAHATAVQIQAGRTLIEGDLTLPTSAAGLVVFAHGSGSSRFSRRNRSVAIADGGLRVLARGSAPPTAGPIVRPPPPA